MWICPSCGNVLDQKPKVKCHLCDYPVASHHYIYSFNGESGPRRWGTATINKGHNGTMLSCTHKDCVAIREGE